jgi:hypothetical protein
MAGAGGTFDFAASFDGGFWDLLLGAGKGLVRNDLDFLAGFLTFLEVGR